jgi:hypothetical protein
MQHNPPPRQLALGLLPRNVAGAPDWEALDPQRQARAVQLLARLIARAAAAPDAAEGTRDD